MKHFQYYLMLLLKNCYQNFVHYEQIQVLNIYYLHYLLEIYIVNCICCVQILTFFQNNDNDFLQVFFNILLHRWHIILLNFDKSGLFSISLLKYFSMTTFI